ncbi:MAG: hypothetical protein H7Y37_21120 [Anaerolineae bacterium]|nr:hypothetical protein [Gloeobacterales cyanobacterium ES-bin-313]
MQTRENQEVLPTAQTSPMSTFKEELQILLTKAEVSLAKLEALYRQFKKHDTA